MSPVFVYSDGYYADIGAHVFPIEKYRRVYEALHRRGIIKNLIEPEAASREDLLLVHDVDYVEDLIQARATPRTSSSELDRKSTRLNSSHIQKSRMPSSA